jgi:hypothetical protein
MNLSIGSVDMMGIGKRFTYKIDKNSETNPGPGMYSNVNPNTIKLNTTRSQNGSLNNSRFAFGVGRE